MAINKKNEFDESLLQIAEWAKALSHPARIAILQTLAERKTCICGEIVEVLPLAQATVSQHLKELKKVGLVTGQINGVKSCYGIDWEVLHKAFTAFRKYFENIEWLESDSYC